MTNKEAIANIEYRIQTATELTGTGDDGKAYEDLELAIQALQVLDNIQSYIKRVQNSGLGKKKALEYIEKFTKCSLANILPKE